jgi:hypothetical protein
MKNNLAVYIKSGFKIAYNVNTIVPIIFSSITLGLFLSVLNDLVKRIVGDSTANLFFILLATLAVILLAPIAIGLGLRQTAKAKSDPLLASKDRPQLHKGLILLVSNEQPCQVAIDFHLQQNTLKQCWLICSVETLPVAQAIRSLNQDKITIDDPIIINDVYDPAQFISVIDTIYTNAAKLPNIWRESDIIADFSGMTANGSVGMALACKVKNRPLQYTPAVRESGTNKIIGSAEPIEIKLQ